MNTIKTAIKWEIRSLDPRQGYNVRYEVIGTWDEGGERVTCGDFVAYCETIRAARSALRLLRREHGDYVWASMSA